MRALVLLGLLLIVPTAQAAGEELAILDAFLAPHDEPAAQGEHCRRHGGPSLEALREVPALTAGTPVAATNAHLRAHLSWHRQSTSAASDPARDPASRYGEDFVLYHRAMVAQYEAWRAENGHPPLQPWDPATPIPPAFATEAEAPSWARAPYPGCAARLTDEPRVERPTWATVEGGDARDPVFGRTSLCAFPSLDELGKAIDVNALGLHGGERGYHARVHERVGGDLADPSVSPRDPVFWAWHKFLDTEVFARWERECAAPAERAALPPAEARTVPVAPALAALLVAVALRRR